MSLSDSDIEEGLKKVSLAHESYQIPASSCKPDIEKFYDDIHSNIEELNQKLIGLFKKKEDDLCNMYKREMTKAQKRLRELQECTSEQELNKRKIEKKEKLQKERQKFLETSIYFSNQCKEFKSTLTKVVSTTKDLEAEIAFLNEQIVFADRHSQKLAAELEQLKQEVRRYEPDAKLDNLEDVLSLPPKLRALRDANQQNNNSSLVGQEQASSILQDNQNGSIGFNQTASINKINNSNFQNNTRSQQGSMSKYISPYGKKQIMKPSGPIESSDLEKAKAELKRQQEINEKLQEFLNDPCFQETEFERLFMDCVVSVRQKKTSNAQNSRLPAVKNKGNEFNNTNNDTTNQSNFDKNKGSEQSTLDFTTISDLDFNEFHKRQILEEFLSKDEIKKYLYSLIFSNNNASAGKTKGSNPQKANPRKLEPQQLTNKNNSLDPDQSQGNVLDDLKRV